MSRSLLLFVILGLGLAPPACGQEDPAADGPPPATEVPTDGGFWPTPRMVERIIDRITDDGIGLYTFDEIQLDQTRAILKERVPRWMAENRAEIMTLTNAMFEALLDAEPPSPEWMARWAGRVLPVVGSFENEVIAITDEMREFLTDDQIVVLDGQVSAFQTGLSLATNKVREWADGKFDPAVDWPTEPEEAPPDERMVEPAPVETEPPAPGASPSGSPPTAPGPPPVAPPDAWATYTDEFIRKYELNAEQQHKARSHLVQAQTNRDTYLSKPRTLRERREVDELLSQLKDATGAEAEQERAAAEARKQKLDEPVENEFNRLKKKLDTLPTREQRRKAHAAEAAASQPAPPAEPGGTRPAQP